MTSDTQPQPIIPGLASFYDTFAPRGYALIRFGFGAILVVHGYMKLFHGLAPIIGEKLLGPMGFPAPIAWAYFLGILEFAGGGLLAVGLFTRPIALMLAVEMAIVTFAVHFPHGFFFSAPGGGYEYPLLLLILSVGFLLGGSGRCSVDRAIGKEF
jgi:putative oxidoreductase